MEEIHQAAARGDKKSAMFTLANRVATTPPALTCSEIYHGIAM